MKKSLILVIFFLLFYISVDASERKSYEMPRTQVIPIQDSESGGQYELYIKLPEEYLKDSDKIYPVIYFTDAMWHIEILSGSTEYIMEDAILVGISWQKDIEEDIKKKYGVHASRFEDYSFWKTTHPEHPKLQFGQASNHLDFIRNDVFNYVEQNYRTNPNDRSYFGYSLGGVFGAYILVTQPDTFKNYVLGSPSVHLLTKYKIEFTNKKLNANVFISRGTLEEELREPISEFVTLLKARNDNSLSIESVVIEGNHGTAFPMTGVRSVIWLSQLNNVSELKGAYLDQKPPSLTPEPFAPGIITTEHWEYGGTFTPDLKEFYFIRKAEASDKQEFVVLKNINNQWQESVVSPRVGQPIISPDGKIMHLGKRYKERTKAGWSEIKSLGSPFEDIPIMRLTASSKGTLVFDEFTRDGNGVLWYSRVVDGKREDPKPLSKEINTGKSNAHPFIAPDESYILWDGKRVDGYGNADIYVSFRQQDGSWGEAINLGDKINTDAWEAAASVTPDGKYLFFNRNMGSDKYENVDIFWVDAQVIENLRPKNKNSTTTASPYLGQKPPGLIPEIFAPGIISINGRTEGVISFSPDLDEIYFGANDENEKRAIYFSKLEGNKWTPIEKVAFTKGKKDEEAHPFVSTIGKRIYFTAYSSDVSDTGIWYVNRLEHSWSDAIKLDLPINDDKAFFYNQAKKGGLYYFNISKQKNYSAAYSNGDFPEVKEFEIEPGLYHLFTSPNEDYFVAHGPNKEDENRSDNDIYVSFKEQDGTWAKAINLGSAVNSNVSEAVPNITPDGKYMFFARAEEDGTENAYWVSTEIITELKTAYFK